MLNSGCWAWISAEMGLAQAGFAVDEQGVVGVGGLVGHRQRGAVGKAVGGAHHKAFEGELGIIDDEIGMLGFFCQGLSVFLSQKDHVHIHIEQHLHGVLDIGDPAALDGLAAEFRRR